MFLELDNFLKDLKQFLEKHNNSIRELNALLIELVPYQGPTDNSFGQCFPSFSLQNMLNPSEMFPLMTYKEDVVIFKYKTRFDFKNYIFYVRDNNYLLINDTKENLLSTLPCALTFPFEVASDIIKLQYILFVFERIAEIHSLMNKKREKFVKLVDKWEKVLINFSK